MTSTYSRKLLYDSLKSRKFRLNPSIAVEASFTPVTGVDRFNLFEDSWQCESLSDQISQKPAPLSFLYPDMNSNTITHHDTNNNNLDINHRNGKTRMECHHRTIQTIHARTARENPKNIRQSRRIWRTIEISKIFVTI